MNYNSMTDVEMLHYLDLYSDDPVIRRLVDVLQNTRGALLADLENAGMDPKTWTFKTDWQDQYPGDYIMQLRSNVESAQEEMDELRYKYENLKDKYDELKTRNIMQFIEEVKQEQRANQELVREAMATVQAYKNENENLKEKIDMWGRMNQVKQGV